MDGFREISISQATYLCAFALGIMGCFIAKMLSRMAAVTFRWLGLDKNSQSKEEEAETIRKATLQIGQDWIEMMKTLEYIRDEQTSFANRLQPEIEARNQSLYQNVTVCLEQEFLRNDQRFKKFKGMIESMHDDVSFLKNSIQSFNQKKVLEANEGVIQKLSLVDNCVQTDYEFKRKASKNSLVAENEGSQLVAMVKECLAGVINDAKLQISIDREDESRELQIVFQKLAEDRKEIKKTIIQAFSLAAEQARKNFDKFGQDAIHYIAVLNENTNKMLKVKFEETDDRLEEILRALNRQILDVVTIQKILENIDGQFDDIFQRVELGCQRNTENCEEIAQSLEKTSNTMMNATSELESMTENFGNNIGMFKGILNDMKEVMNSMNSNSTVNHHSTFTEADEILHYDSNTGIAGQDITLSQKKQHLVFMYNVIQTCWEKLTSLNSGIGDGYTEIYQQFQTLAQRLQSLNASAEALEDAIKSVNVENFTGGIVCVKHPDFNSGETNNVMKASNGDSGDCLPDIYDGSGTASFKKSLSGIIQVYSATTKKDEAMKTFLSNKMNKDNSNSSNDAALNQDVPLTVDESQAATIENRS